MRWLQSKWQESGQCERANAFGTKHNPPSNGVVQCVWDQAPGIGVVQCPYRLHDAAEAESSLSVAVALVF